MFRALEKRQKLLVTPRPFHHVFGVGDPFEVRKHVEILWRVAREVPVPDHGRATHHVRLPPPLTSYALFSIESGVDHRIIRDLGNHRLVVAVVQFIKGNKVVAPSPLSFFENYNIPPALC